MSTLVAVVSDDLVPALGPLAAAANLSVEAVDELPDDLTARSRAVGAAWRRASGRGGSVYTLVPVDPLTVVVEAWARRLTDDGDDLELAIGLVGDPPMPDYYLIAPGLPDPVVHWYTDHLHRLAPDRVLVVEMTPGAIAKQLAGLPYGSPLPDASTVAESARTYVPLPELTP